MTAATVFREPFVESFTRVMRQGTLRRNSKRLLHCHTCDPGSESPISEPRHRAAEASKKIDVAEDSLAQRQPIAPPSRVKHLGFKQCEIHVRGAFRRATFAGKTIAKRGVQLDGLQRIVSVYSELKRGANDVGAAARGHDFFAGGHECRAHNAGLFEAAAAAVALLEIADERAVLERERERR